jgi:UDP-N-acetylglucosamine 2-epimerase (non-hydrolysing)
MKASPVMSAISAYGRVKQVLVHTGQHYDPKMSDIFFQQLALPEPDINLEVGSGSHSFQTAQIMMRFEEVVTRQSPDWVLVYGDVNSTIAAAIVCAKLIVPVAHVEAGLRSGDRTMPEEINRLLTDQIANLLFTPSEDGDQNLLQEGISAEKIYRVGNVMIDTLIRMLPKLHQVTINDLPNRYILVTLHRPSNVDQVDSLRKIIGTLLEISSKIPVIFPMHPRTRKRLDEFGIDLPSNRPLHLWEPVGYLEFLLMQKHATAVITDSGGIQEETTFLQVPCLTLRNNTERPITITHGSNTLVGQDMNKLRQEVERILSGKTPVYAIPPLWDGKAGERIARILVS